MVGVMTLALLPQVLWESHTAKLIVRHISVLGLEAALVILNWAVVLDEDKAILDDVLNSITF